MTHRAADYEMGDFSCAEGIIKISSRRHEASKDAISWLRNELSRNSADVMLRISEYT